MTLPPGCGEITAHARLIHLDQEVGLAEASVFGADGRLVAHGTSRCSVFPAIDESIDLQIPSEPVSVAAVICREFGFAFHLAVTQLEHAEWLIGQGRADEAQPLLEEACETFERLEATPWLERVDAAQSATPAATPA